MRLQEFVENVRYATIREEVRFTSHAEDEVDEENYSYADIIKDLYVGK